MHACMHTSADFMGPSSGVKNGCCLFTPPRPLQALRHYIFNRDEMVLTTILRPRTSISIIFFTSFASASFSSPFVLLSCHDPHTRRRVTFLPLARAGPLISCNHCPHHIGIFLSFYFLIILTLSAVHKICLGVISPPTHRGIKKGRAMTDWT